MYRIAAFLTILICLSAASPGFGQDNNLTLDSDNLPEWRGNTRFLTTHFPVKHPSLSLNGFDCGSDCGNGYGLKQVLEKIYGTAQDDRMQGMWKWLIEKAGEPLASITNSSPLVKVQENTQILQSRALIALASYVVEQNGTDPTTLTITVTVEYSRSIRHALSRSCS